MTKTYYLVLAICVVGGLCRAETRSVERTLAHEERVDFPALGISMLLPARTELLKANAWDEPKNYIFPWVHSPQGSIDIAMAFGPKEGTLEERVQADLERMNKGASGLRSTGVLQKREVSGIAFVRVEVTGKFNYRIVRYYFVGAGGRLVFLHFHGGADLQRFEDVVIGSVEPSAR